MFEMKSKAFSTSFSKRREQIKEENQFSMLRSTSRCHVQSHLSFGLDVPRAVLTNIPPSVTLCSKDNVYRLRC